MGKTKVVLMNGKKAYQWETKVSLLSKETFTSKTNIGWEVTVDKNTHTFLENYGGMTQNFFSFMKDEKVKKFNILVYTTENSNIITLIQFLDKENNQLKWSYAEGKSFAYIVQSKYIQELKDLCNVKEIVPSNVVSGELPVYVEPTLDNSSGLFYKGNEIPFSTQQKEQVFLIKLNDENKLKLIETGIVSKKFSKEISHFKVILDKELNAFGSLATLEVYLENNEALKRKHTDTYFTDVYGENSSDEEIEEFSIKESLEDIQEEMNSVYKETKDYFKNKEEGQTDFDEVLNARLRKQKRAFDVILENALESVEYANKVDSHMIGKNLLQWMFDNDEN